MAVNDKEMKATDQQNMASRMGSEARAFLIPSMIQPDSTIAIPHQVLKGILLRELRADEIKSLYGTTNRTFDPSGRIVSWQGNPELCRGTVPDTNLKRRPSVGTEKPYFGGKSSDDVFETVRKMKLFSSGTGNAIDCLVVSGTVTVP
jgi:hypothetical protein